MRFLLLLLVIAAVYVLFFRKYNVNGEDVKGWLAKRKADEKAQPSQHQESTKRSQPLGERQRGDGKKKAIPVSNPAPATDFAGTNAHTSGETDYTIILKPTDTQNKLAVVKAVKDGLGIGLKEAKDLVDEPADKVLAEHVDKATADNLKQLLIEAHANFSIKEYKY